MGTSENTRRRLGRWQVMELVMVMVVLVGSGLCQVVPSQSPCPEGATPHSLEQPVYEESVRPVGDFMASFVQSFLNTVQPKPFPKDLVLEIVQDPGNTLSNQEFVKEVLVYGTGFLVCVAIGVLYIVLMPIVGLFLACCRCCGNCGGKMQQKQTSSIHCRRRALYSATFVTTVIILAGNICMFRSNESLKRSVDSSTVEINVALSNINTFLTAVPQQVQFVVNESYVTIEEVTKNLDAIGPQLGSEIQKQFESTFTPALQSLIILDQEVVNTSALLKKLNTSLNNLESNASTIQIEITNVKNEINETLSKPDCTNCENMKPELNKLTVDTSIDTSSLDELQTALNEMIKADLNSKIKEVEMQFKNIPESVTNDTREVVKSSKAELAKIKSQISNISTDLPLSSLNDVLTQLENFQANISTYSPEVERVEYIRWCVCITLCCVILLVVVCNVFGLALGPLGLKSKVEPTKRSCTSDCGGTFFMMGAGFSFLISWLFMILVLILFLIGANAYTLLCKPWRNGELLQLLDTPGVIPGFNLSETFGANITISSIYRDCEEDKPAWSVFQFNQHINLDDLLNVSKYTDEIKKDFEDTNIDLSPINFLTPEVKDQLKSFASKSGNIDFSTTVQEINNFTKVNLNTTADKLDQLAQIQTGQIKMELKNEAQKLRKIQADIETVIFPQLTTVSSTIDELKTTLTKSNATVGEVLRSVGVAQDFFNKNATQIVKTESGQFLDCQLGYFTAFADWARNMITQELGRCGPVAGAVDSANIIICSNMVESLNAFWFSLGWCMIFLIPSIIFSIKLAKYYRRMKYNDVFDTHINMINIPRPTMRIS
ncbi:prominin-2 [Periophthalmus magnuspinnatus]|uniref:prominin-2 n=1 Tax=Periophthalmus magnuspinnatus TaxID=409849 RepID=UPI00145B4C47|nr:prominin-2 [Periophthalmus magnuspinnatus]